jgi:hypothetical protein
MDFRCIFTNQDSLWAVCYPENQVDGKTQSILKVLLEQWNDTEYLTEFFVANQEKLNTPFWSGISIDDAIDKVIDEAQNLHDELWRVSTKQKGYENCSLSEIFEPLHDNILSLRSDNENHRKARTRPDLYPKPMLRLYALELEDSTYVLTGGGIKLLKVMDDIHKEKLRSVQLFLKQEGITTREGLSQ